MKIKVIDEYYSIKSAVQIEQWQKLSPKRAKAIAKKVCLDCTDDTDDPCNVWHEEFFDDHGNYHWNIYSPEDLCIVIESYEVLV